MTEEGAPDMSESRLVDFALLLGFAGFVAGLLTGFFLRTRKEKSDD